MSKTLEVHFSALDSWFFRGSRPHSAAGGSILASEFPPPPSTLIGAFRTYLGDALGIDWQQLREQRICSDLSFSDSESFLKSLYINDSENNLTAFSEPWVSLHSSRLYPVPAILKSAESGLVHLTLGEAVKSDLGNIRLLQQPSSPRAAKAIDSSWLTETGMQAFLNGQPPKPEDLIHNSKLICHESRLGIGRDTSLGTVQPGLLYQTEHIRLENAVSLAIRVTLPTEVADFLMQHSLRSPLLRLGGEGRMAEVSIKPVHSELSELSSAKQPNLLVLLTPYLPTSTASAMPLDNFNLSQHKGVDCWEGEIHGVGIRIHAMCSGPSTKIGGWNAKTNQPKPIQTYLPAGSCFFAETIDQQQHMSSLHGKQIGRRQDSGFGTLLCAKAYEQQTINKEAL